MIQKIKDNWQILTVTIILWSFFDLYIYYAPLGIDIQNYLSSTELLFLVLPSFIKALIILGILYAFTYYSLANSPKVNPDSPRVYYDKYYTLIADWSLIIDSFRDKNLLIRFLFAPAQIVVILIKYLFFVFTTFCLFSILFQLFIKNDLYFFFSEYQLIPGLQFVVIMCTLPLLLTVSEIFQYSKNPNNQKLSVAYSPLAYFLFLFILSSVVTDRAAYVLVKKGKSKINVSFDYEKQKVATNSKLLYIGQTSSYIFLKNLEDGSNLFFKVDKIENLVQKEIVIKPDTTKQF